MNKAAFNAHYRAHYHQVFGLCRRMLGNTQDAEDATQEVFMKGYRSYAHYRQHRPFGPWINSIASNYCIDLLRRRKRLTAVFADIDTESEEPVDTALATEDALIDAHDAHSINEAVVALPEKYRLPIVMAYYSDASYEDIAKKLGIKKNHVGVLLLRARQQLRLVLNSTIAEI